MSIRLVTPPVEEPISLTQAKSHLRLEDTNQDDDYLTQLLIPAARQYIERVCWRGLLLQTWELTLGGFRGPDRFDMAPDWRPSSPNIMFSAFPVNWLGSDSTYRFQPFLELPRGHLANTPNLTITYLDENAATQTLNASTYLVEGTGSDNMLGRVWLNTAQGYEWPNTLAQFNAVKVQYQVGWDDADAVPTPIRQAILVVLGQMYEHRTPEIESRLAESEFTSTTLISPYRFNRV